MPRSRSAQNHRSSRAGTRQPRTGSPRRRWYRPPGSASGWPARPSSSWGASASVSSTPFGGALCRKNRGASGALGAEGTWRRISASYCLGSRALNTPAHLRFQRPAPIIGRHERPARAGATGDLRPRRGRLPRLRAGPRRAGARRLPPREWCGGPLRDEQLHVDPSGLRRSARGDGHRYRGRGDRHLHVRDGRPPPPACPRGAHGPHDRRRRDGGRAAGGGARGHDGGGGRRR